MYAYHAFVESLILLSFRLHGGMRIRKKDAGVIKNIYANDSVSNVNNIFDSLWNKVIVKLK